MNIEFRFLEKAIKDKNYISFSYEKENIRKVKPLELLEKEDNYFLKTPNRILEFNKITKLQILKERF